MPCAERFTRCAESGLPTSGPRPTRNGHDDGGHPCWGPSCREKANIKVDTQPRRRIEVEASGQGPRKRQQEMLLARTAWPDLGTTQRSTQRQGCANAVGLGPLPASLPAHSSCSVLRRLPDQIVSGSPSVEHVIKSHLTSTWNQHQPVSISRPPQPSLDPTARRLDPVLFFFFLGARVGSRIFRHVVFPRLCPTQAPAVNGQTPGSPKRPLLRVSRLRTPSEHSRPAS